MRSRSSRAARSHAEDRRGWPRDVLRGIGYAERVVTGEQVVGRFVRLACHRFLADLRAASRPRSRWRFDPERAAHLMKFAQLMPNIKGPEAGSAIYLMDWQCWVLSNLFGFVDRKTGARRFRQASIWVPRGNGKTTLVAPVALYLTFLEGEGGAEGYAAAVTRDQAKILWDTAKEMVDRTPQLRARAGITTARNSIYQGVSASKFVAVSSDAKALDGLSVHVAVCDEIGSHKTASVYDVLLTALGKRSQPLLISISTATGNNAGIGKKVHDYTQKVLEGSLKDDRFFGVIYAADPEDPVWEDSTLAKANPGWGVTVQPDAIFAIRTQARSSPAQEIVFKTRHLNLWVSADHSLFSLDSWNRCADRKMRLEDFAGRPCYVGLDLSSKIDMASAALIFPEHEPGSPPRYAIFSKSWLPEETVALSRNASYPGWAKDGALTVTEGQTTDFDAVERTLLEWSEQFDILGIGYDPWNAKQLAQRMQNEGLPMVEIRQTIMNMSEPTKELDALMRARRVRHTGNEVLTWAISCIIGRYDEKQNVYPRKNKNSDDKIDAAIAVIMGMAQAVVPTGAAVVVTESPFMTI